MPQSPKEILGALQDSTAAVQENTATLRELLHGGPIGTALLITLLALLYVWSWHLTRSDSVRSGKYRMLGGVGVLSVYVSCLGAGSVHAAAVGTPELGTVLTNAAVFSPLLLGSAIGYHFDRKAVLQAAPDEQARAECAAAVGTVMHAAAVGGSAGMVLVALAHTVRRLGIDDATAQGVVLGAVAAAALVLVGWVWIRSATKVVAAGSAGSVPR